MEDTLKGTFEKYFETRNINLRDTLMVQYLDLVYYVVNKLMKNIPDMKKHDLVGYGVIGLSEALDRFDPNKGVKFETYAIHRIRGAIIDELRKLDLLPRSLRTKERQISKVVEELLQLYDGEVPNNVIARYLGISEELLQNWQSDLVVDLISLDQPQTRGGEGKNLHEMIEDQNGQNPLDEFEKKEKLAMLIQAIKKLSEKSRYVIFCYYYQKLTFKEIGKFLNVSESRISQIHKETIGRLKQLIV